MAVDLSNERKLSRLRIWNIVVGLILAVQAILIAVLTNSFSLPVTATLTGHYRMLTNMTGVTAGWVSRADVAHFILKEFETNQYLRQTPLLTY